MRYVLRNEGDLEVFDTRVTGVKWFGNGKSDSYLEIGVEHPSIKRLKVDRFLRVRNGDPIRAYIDRFYVKWRWLSKETRIRALKETEEPYKIELLDGSGEPIDTYVFGADRDIVEGPITLRVYTR